VSAYRHPPPGDQVKISVSVEVEPHVAFQIFTEEIDQWWRRGFKYRASGRQRSVIRLEPKVGGRLFESFTDGDETRVVQTGCVTVCEPPTRLVFDWWATNFAPDEKTEVEVVFSPSRRGTFVVVTHRGWSKIRPDHPARHGLQTAAFLRMIGLWWGDLMSSLRSHSGGRRAS
jgi:uncharacterized protein YndB with AHSA1/START domain